MTAPPWAPYGLFDQSSSIETWAAFVASEAVPPAGPRHASGTLTGGHPSYVTQLIILEASYPLVSRLFQLDGVVCHAVRRR